MNRPSSWPGPLRRPTLFILLAAPLLLAAATLPARAYVIQGKPSAVVQDHEAMLALALQLEKDLKADLGKSADPGQERPPANSTSASTGSRC